MKTTFTCTFIAYAGATSLLSDGPNVNVHNFYGDIHGDIRGFVLDGDCPDTDEETDGPEDELEFACPESKYPEPTV